MSLTDIGPPEDAGEETERGKQSDVRPRPFNGAPAPAKYSAIERCEIELLAGCFYERENWVLVEEKLAAQDLSSGRAARIFKALQLHYAQSDAPPAIAEQLVAFGCMSSDDAVELTRHIPASGTLIASLLRDIKDAASKRSSKSKIAQAEEALKQGQTDLARALIDEAKGSPVSAIQWHSTAEIFGDLPESTWKVRGLQIGPGRPTMIAAYGATAKTLCAQSMALSVAAGRLVWGFFETNAPGSVLHFDYEQGFYATARRYQRLAIGHGIDESVLGGRLSLTCFPRVFLDGPGAVDAYCRACQKSDLVILDSLRAAAPTRDENDSQMRVCLDVLTQVSDKTGCAFVILHHAGKPKDGQNDARMLARGSSAIFDAAGCVFTLTAGKKTSDPRRVRQSKQPAEAVGGAVEEFELVVEDVEFLGDKVGGVRVKHQVADSQSCDPEMSGEAWERDCVTLLEVIRHNPMAGKNEITARCGLRKVRALALLDSLMTRGRVVVVAGPNRSQLYRIEDV